MNNVDTNIYFKCLNGGNMLNELKQGQSISD